jgi:signal peptidase I
MLVGQPRRGLYLFGAFVLSATLWFALMGTFIGGVAAFCAFSLMGSSVLDTLRMDPKAAENRLPVRGRDVLMAVAIIGCVYAAGIWAASAVWQRVTINQPILRLNPGGLPGEIAFERGDRLLVRRGAYRDEDPSRSDVVLARVGGMLMVQRVIAVPGDILELEGRVLYLNRGELPKGAYPLQPEDPVEVRAGRLIQHRETTAVRTRRFIVWGVQHSGDRVWLGPREIGAQDILGKAWVVYSPYRNRRVIDHQDPVLKRGAEDGATPG